MLFEIFKETFSSVIVRAVFLILFSLWIKWVWSRRRYYVLSYKLPGPISVPIFGNMAQLGSFTDHRRIMPRLKKMKDKYGGFFRIWIGPEFLLVICQPEDYECILTSKATYNKGFIYDMIKYTINEGLLCGSGQVWKRHRHVINPSFALSTIRKYQSNHNFYAAKMAESMGDLVDKDYFDAFIFSQRYFTDTLCDSLFEMKINCYTGENDKVLIAANNAALIVHERMCKFWLQNNFIFEHNPIYKEYIRLYKIYEKFFHPRLLKRVDDLVEVTKKNKTAIQKLESYENLEEDYILEQNTDVKSKSVLKVLTEAYMAGDMTRQEIVDEFDNILTPGMDTSYTQLSAFILMMAMHKRPQDKLWNEIKDFYSHDMDAEVTTDHFNHLPYLDMVFKETMRHFPTGPMQMRKVKEDFYLKSRDLVVPAGTQFILLNIILHKDEKFWKNPLEFYPERFSPEESAKRPYFAYIPFSIGLRNCIGQVFATDSIKTGAIHLIRNYEFTADPSWKLESLPTTADISLRSALGYKVKIKRRERFT